MYILQYKKEFGVKLKRLCPFEDNYVSIHGQEDKQILSLLCKRMKKIAGYFTEGVPSS
jgi:hypothetical protein